MFLEIQLQMQMQMEVDASCPSFTSKLHGSPHTGRAPTPLKPSPSFISSHGPILQQIYTMETPAPTQIPTIQHPNSTSQPPASIPACEEHLGKPSMQPPLVSHLVSQTGVPAASWPASPGTPGRRECSPPTQVQQAPGLEVAAIQLPHPSSPPPALGWCLKFLVRDI